MTRRRLLAFLAVTGGVAAMAMYAAFAWANSPAVG